MSPRLPHIRPRPAQANAHARAVPRASSEERRFWVIKGSILLVMAVIGWRLFVLQVLQHQFYSDLADSQRDRYSNFVPDRGTVYALDPKSPDGRFPVAVNKTLYTVYANTRALKDPRGAAERLAPLLEMDVPTLLEKLSRKDAPYVPLKPKADDDLMSKVKALDITGIGFDPSKYRFYPEKSSFSHVVGFYGSDDSGKRVGRYGVEGHWQPELSGTSAAVDAGDDSLGTLIGGANRFIAAKDGDDLTLTVDRNIQYVTCSKLREAVAKHQADTGSAIVMNPMTGAVMAICNVPDFDPNDLSSVKDYSALNDRAVFSAYEPGSIFKAITMAAAIDAGKVTPNSTYVDEGSVKIGPFTIQNSDHKAHGLQTMTQVLDESLNTGTIYASRLVGAQQFLKYVEAFGFGSPLGIDLDTESSGNIDSLRKKGDIWSATASFGQGITVTPLQMAAAYSAIANGGKLMKPYVVGSITHSDGTTETVEPEVIRQVITKRAASLVSGMLVSVVEKGHGKKAAVPGYFVAGKTGTAQVPSPDGHGYLKGVNIGSFAGFAPVDNPAFVIVVELDNPKDVEWAESSAGPLFGDIAKYLLQYLQIPPERN